MLTSSTKETIDFLFPKTLSVSPSNIRHTVIIGSCLADDGYRKHFEQCFPELRVDFILYNNPSEIYINPEDLATIDFQFVQLPLRSVLTDVVLRFDRFVEDMGRSSPEQAAFDRLRLMFDGAVRYARSAKIPTLVGNFIVPQRIAAASLKEAGTSLDLVHLTRALNTRLAELVAAEDDCFLVDLEGLAASLGKAYILDDWHHIHSHNTTFNEDWTETSEAPFFLNQWLPPVREFRPSIEREFYHAIWRQLESAYRTIRQIDQVKLVVFDLDNTLSRGLIAEHHGSGPDRAWDIGWPEGIREAIHHLRARGILVALCSKNDQATVEKYWDEAFPGGVLSLDDFVVHKIDWGTKVAAIENIMRQLSLTPKSVVFVDDNHLEREAVQIAFPAIRVIGENQMLTRSTLLWSAECQVAVRTNETRQRDTMMRGQIERETARSSTSRDDFLMSLDCRVSLFEVTPESPHFQRCAELINKTNQFNTTGRRWTTAELVAFLGGGGRIFAFDVEDRYTKYGLVGVILFKAGRFVQFVMSCRVIGLGIEETAVHQIMAHYAGFHSCFKAEAIDTELNTVSRDIYNRCGFSFEPLTSTQSRSNKDIPAIPHHLTLRLSLPALTHA